MFRFPQQQTPFGYGTAPGQSGRGYFEQQTPAGSFAAAEQQRMRGVTANNPYIGQQTGQIQGAAPVNAATASASNPYIGQQTQQVDYQAAQGVGANQFAGANPYLSSVIQGTVNDATQGFNDVVNPQFDRMAQASGSFGNTGVEAARSRAQQDFGRGLSNTISGMRMQDYGMQQGLAEAALNRQQNMNQFNAGNQLQASMANAGFNAADLSRNLGALSQIGMFNAGQLNNMGQFNAGLNQGTQQFNAGLRQGDLTRNANLAQNMGQFNAGALNQASMFNAGQGNAMNLANAGAANNMLENFRGRQENARQFDANFGEGQRRYDEGMDFQTWAANNAQQRNAYMDQMNALDRMLGWQGAGMNAANQAQSIPMNVWQQLVGGGATLGGIGGGTTQNLFGNPFLGALGGWQLGQNIFGGRP